MVDIHPQLVADTVQVKSLQLCEVLLMTDANFPWLVLVPRVEGVREVRSEEHTSELQSRL